MVPRGRGKIINVCSLQTQAPRAGIAAYPAAKGALKMLTKGMCADLAGHGIQDNAIGPRVLRDRPHPGSGRRRAVQRVGPPPHARRPLG